MASCHFNSQYIDRTEDKMAGEVVTNKLYDYIKNKKYEETISLCSQNFFEKSTKEDFIKLLQVVNEKIGDLEDVNIDSWNTRRVVGSNPSANYLFIYKNKYAKFTATETIKLTREQDDQIRIIAYNIQVDGFE